jgi:putative flippase GtrA
MDSIYFGPLAYFVSLFLGTLVGLIVKYLLDKKYIFYYSVKSKQEDMKKFVIYATMGVVTTAIFWGFQTGFHILWNVEYAKYIGAIIGLSIGYFVKYQLDKRFVFTKQDQIELETTIG